MHNSVWNILNKNNDDSSVARYLSTLTSKAMLAFSCIPNISGWSVYGSVST